GIAATIAPAVVPLLAIAGIVEITAEQPEIGADGFRVLEQGGRRHRVGTDRRLAGPENMGFLKADLLAGITEPIDVIEIHTGYDRAIGVDDVHGIETAAQPDF